MKPLSEQIAAAENFLRVARFHQDDPRPERLEQVRRELIDALDEGKVAKGARKVAAALILCLGFAGFASAMQTVVSWLHA